MEEDLILGEEKTDLVNIIENQIYILSNLMDMPDGIYNAFDEDRTKVYVKAMHIIIKAQVKILKELSL